MHATGFHSVLVVPLVDQQGRADRWWCCKTAGEFSQNLIGLMKTFAHQSVLAMRNARLFSAEVDTKSRELQTAHSTVREQADKPQEQTEQRRTGTACWRSASRPSSPRSSASAGSNASSRCRSRS